VDNVAYVSSAKFELSFFRGSLNAINGGKVMAKWQKNNRNFIDNRIGAIGTLVLLW